MIGPTVTAPRNAIQPVVKPIRLPKANCGNRALPPATGYMPPSSACVNARSITTPPPRAQEMTAAGPASDVAYNAPNNQPAPMIDPRDAKRSPNKPMSRRSVRLARSEVATSGCANSAVALTPSNMGARDLLGHGLDHGPSSSPPQLRRTCRAPGPPGAMPGHPSDYFSRLPPASESPVDAARRRRTGIRLGRDWLLARTLRRGGMARSGAVGA